MAKKDICPECGAVMAGGAKVYMALPLPDIIDRYTITKLKLIRFSPEQKAREPMLDAEISAYEAAIARIRTEYHQVDEWINELLDANGACWDLEWEIRALSEDEPQWDEIGKRTLLIRKENGRRVAARNKIVHATGHGFFDHKVGHTSERDVT
jgi:hypothetical protein